MPVYWSANSVPELKDLPPAERKRQWQVAYKQALKTPRGMLGIGAMAVCLIVALSIGTAMGGGILRMAIAGGVGGGIGGALMAIIMGGAVYEKIMQNQRAAGA